MVPTSVPPRRSGRPNVLGAVAGNRPLPRREGLLLPPSVSSRYCAGFAAGETNKANCAALVVSEPTVERHVSNIFTKLRVSSRTGLRPAHTSMTSWERAYGWNHPGGAPRKLGNSADASLFACSYRQRHRRIADASEEQPEEATMAIAMLVENPEGSQELYERIRKQLELEAPAGGIL